MAEKGEIFPVTESKPGWHVETLRITAFPSPAADIGEPNWWKSLFKDEPEKRTSKQKVGLLQEEGPFGEGRLVLQVQRNRIDWVLGVDSDKIRERLDEKDFPSIGLFEETVEPFADLMRQWLRLGLSIQRLAFGAVLVFPVGNKQSAYENLSKFIGSSVKLDPVGSSDFLYRINRPRDFGSGLEGLSINRLAKWSSFVWQVQDMALSPGFIKSTLGQEAHASRLELDINTNPNFERDLPPERLINIFDRLIEFGKEISVRGDIP
ncbi:MAG: hypothetical protein LLH30_16170 [Candidatus Manganitrophus sp. SA1]|nr:hypothetical protein [Candidatus Manganitrophus morganii]